MTAYTALSKHLSLGQQGRDTPFFCSCNRSRYSRLAKSPKFPLLSVTRKERSLDRTPIVLVSLWIPTLSVELLQPDIGLSKVPCVSAELLADQIVRLELLAKLSTRYKTIQSVTKGILVTVALDCYSAVYFADCRLLPALVVVAWCLEAAPKGPSVMKVVAQRCLPNSSYGGKSDLLLHRGGCLEASTSTVALAQKNTHRPFDSMRFQSKCYLRRTDCMQDHRVQTRTN